MISAYQFYLYFLEQFYKALYFAWYFNVDRLFETSCAIVGNESYFVFLMVFIHVTHLVPLMCSCAGLQCANRHVLCGGQ